MIALKRSGACPSRSAVSRQALAATTISSGVRGSRGWRRASLGSRVLAGVLLRSSTRRWTTLVCPCQQTEKGSTKDMPYNI